MAYRTLHAAWGVKMCQGRSSWRILLLLAVLGETLQLATAAEAGGGTLVDEDAFLDPLLADCAEGELALFLTQRSVVGVQRALHLGTEDKAVSSAAQGDEKDSVPAPGLEAELAAAPQLKMSLTQEALLGKLDVQSVRAGIPLGALIFGTVLLAAEHRTVGLIVLYFGGNTGFSLYAKYMFSDILVSEQRLGVPAAFLVTAVQQAVAVITLAVALTAISAFTPLKLWPRSLTGGRERAAVWLFSAAFAFNIGLNNFSLSLLPVSMNLTIRSCMPLVTMLVQILVNRIMRPSDHEGGSSQAKVDQWEVVFMIVGVCCAVIATVAENESPGETTLQWHVLVGVAACVASVFAAAFNLVAASMLGSVLKFDPLDTTWHMSLPSAVVLLPPGFLVPHPIDWSGYGMTTDWEVFHQVANLRPWTFVFVALSGLFALSHNLLQYKLVLSLSASHTAFAGNVNKAITIMLSIVLGMETLPQGYWSTVMVVAILGNVMAFTGYTALKVARTELKKEDLKPALQNDVTK